MDGSDQRYSTLLYTTVQMNTSQPEETARQSMPDRALVGHTAVVTGASRGIGRRIVEVFSAAGANVVALARSIERLEPSSERAVLAVPCDITDEAQIDAALQQAAT